LFQCAEFQAIKIAWKQPVCSQVSTPISLQVVPRRIQRRFANLSLAYYNCGNWEQE